MIYIYSYNRYSKSAKAIRDSLGNQARLVHKDRLPAKAIDDYEDLVINWGATEIPFVGRYTTVWNHPKNVSRASNKRKFFEQMGGEVSLPPHWFSREELPDDDTLVCIRRSLTGHSGEGLELMPACEAKQAPAAKLYTKYIKKKYEFRVHVMNTQIIDFQQKARTFDVPDEQVNWQVRNHANGFIYKREVSVSEEMINRAKSLALTYAHHLQLTFCAVDIIYNTTQDKFYVLEVNTAPGLTGTTLINYCEAINNYFGQGAGFAEIDADGRQPMWPVFEEIEEEGF